jgi:streptogramin lyase
MRLVTLLCAVACVTACTSRIEQPLPSFSSSAVPSGAGDTAALTMRVKVPLHPHFVSPATRGMTVAIAGPTKLKKTVGLVLTARGCRSKLTDLACSLVLRGLKVCPSKKPCYTATIATYDAFSSATGKIPPGAHELSADRLAFRIVSGTNVIPIALQGIPASVAFLPGAGSTLTGSQSSGFIEPKCSASTQSASVLGVDADGNYILGAGAPVASLVSDDPAQLAVTNPTAYAPNAFDLVPPSSPAYAFGNFTIHLTATVTPTKKSGAAAISTTVNVSYSGDICGTITEFTIPTAGSSPHGIKAGPDGNMWFTEQIGQIGRITPSGAITEFPVPNPSSRPFDITTGPDGNLWFTELRAEKIAKMTTAGVVTEYGGINASADPTFITAGPDGNLWFSEVTAGNIGKMTPAGAVAEYPVGGGSPAEIAAGPDGRIWFASTGGLGAVTPSGVLAIYSTAAEPFGVAAGPDGAMWFAECTTNDIARMTTGSVETSRYQLPEPSSVPAYVAAGPDGQLWFTEFTGNRIGSISTAGNIAEFSVPTGSSDPFEISPGPDGAMWFVELSANKIARIR